MENLLQTFGIKQITYTRARNLVAVGVITHFIAVWLMFYERVCLTGAAQTSYGTGAPTIFGLVSLGYTALLVAPFCEEFFFRSVIYRAIGRQKVWMDIIQAAVFSLCHNDASRCITLFVLGLFLSAVFRKFGLLGSIAAHAGFNACAFLVTYAWYVLPSVA